MVSDVQRPAKPRVYYSTVKGWRPTNDKNAVVIYTTKGGTTTGQSSEGASFIPSGIPTQGVVQSRTGGTKSVTNLINESITYAPSTTTPSSNFVQVQDEKQLLMTTKAGVVPAPPIAPTSQTQSLKQVLAPPETALTPYLQYEQYYHKTKAPISSLFFKDLSTSQQKENIATGMMVSDIVRTQEQFKQSPEQFIGKTGVYGMTTQEGTQYTLGPEYFSANFPSRKEYTQKAELQYLTKKPIDIFKANIAEAELTFGKVAYEYGYAIPNLQLAFMGNLVRPEDLKRGRTFQEKLFGEPIFKPTKFASDIMSTPTDPLATMSIRALPLLQGARAGIGSFKGYQSQYGTGYAITKSIESLSPIQFQTSFTPDLQQVFLERGTKSLELRGRKENFLYTTGKTENLLTTLDSSIKGTSASLKSGQLIDRSGLGVNVAEFNYPKIDYSGGKFYVTRMKSGSVTTFYMTPSQYKGIQNVYTSTYFDTGKITGGKLYSYRMNYPDKTFSFIVGKDIETLTPAPYSYYEKVKGIGSIPRQQNIFSYQYTKGIDITSRGIGVSVKASELEKGLRMYKKLKTSYYSPEPTKDLMKFTGLGKSGKVAFTPHSMKTDLGTSTRTITTTGIQTPSITSFPSVTSASTFRPITLFKPSPSTLKSFRFMPETKTVTRLWQPVMIRPDTSSTTKTKEDQKNLNKGFMDLKTDQILGRRNVDVTVLIPVQVPSLKTPTKSSYRMISKQTNISVPNTSIIDQGFGGDIGWGRLPSMFGGEPLFGKRKKKKKKKGSVYLDVKH